MFLTVTQAWAYIAEMQWDKRRDYKSIANEWFEKLGEDGMFELERFVGQRVGELYKVVDDFENDPDNSSLNVGSDDGFSDVSLHIVGCGEAEFNRCLKNPREIERRYRSGNYKESFSYCFQAPEKPRSNKQKEDSLKKLLTEVAETQKAFNQLNSEFNKLANHMTVLSMTLNVVLQDRKTMKKSA